MAKLTFGNPWMGQSDRRTIDAAPGVCVSQSNLWLGRPDVLQRRPGMTAYTSTTSYPLSVTRCMIPVNSKIDYYSSSDGKTYEPVLLFQAGDAVTKRYSLLYHSTDELSTCVQNPMVVQGLQDASNLFDGKVASIAAMPGQQVMLIPYPAITGQYDPFLLFVENRSVPRTDAEAVQLLKLRMPGIAMPTLTKTTGGSLEPGKYYFVTYRIELVDSHGIMRMCTGWSEPVGTPMSVDQTKITVTTPYYCGTFVQMGVTVKGIGYNKSPTIADELAFHWNVTDAGASWKYRVQLARTLGGTSTQYSSGPYYLAESAVLSSGQVKLDTGIADSALVAEYDQWVDMSGATDVIDLNGVYVWIKPLAWNHDGLWWGTNEYPYLAYTSNWISVEKNSQLVKLDASTVACLGDCKMVIVSNLPDAPTVQEYPLPATLSPGATWTASSSGPLSVFGQGTDGRIYDIAQRTPITDVIPWLVDDKAKIYKSQATFLGHTTVVQKWNETDSTVISYAVRTADNAIWRLPDGVMASGHYENSSENLHRALNQARAVSGQTYLFRSDDGVPADAVEDTLADSSKVPIQSYWQSAWQSTGSANYKTIKGVDVRQESGSQCTVTLETTDDPASGVGNTKVLTMASPRELQNVNLTAKYFRIKIGSIDSQPWNINDVSVHYDIITAKNGL